MRKDNYKTIVTINLLSIIIVTLLFSKQKS